jgi:cytohesin
MKHLLITTIAAVVLVGCGNPEADRALLQAAEFGNIEAVKQHLAAGADVNAKGFEGWTPLYDAAERGRKEIVELLLAKGANVNAKIEDGRTPLHRAAREGHKEVAELLITKGADVNAKDNFGTTPLDYANDETANLLRKHGGKTGAELKAEGK